MRFAIVTASGLAVILGIGGSTTPVTQGNGAPHTTTDHGCSLFVSVPNPCDPDSYN